MKSGTGDIEKRCNLLYQVTKKKIDNFWRLNKEQFVPSVPANKFEMGSEQVAFDS